MPSNIVIKNQVPAMCPVYNKVEICVLETGFSPSSKPNFKYIFDLNFDSDISGISGVKPFQVAYFPDITATQFGILDVSRYLDGWVKEEIVNPGTVQSVNGFYQGERNYILECFFEIYSGWDVAGVFTKDPDAVGAVTSSTFYVWSGSFDYHEWINQINLVSPFNTWICNITNGTAGKFLDTNPDRQVELGQLGWTYFLTNTLTDIDTMQIRTYNSAGVPVGSFIVTNALAQTSIFERCARVSSAPGSLNLIPGAQVTTGAQPIIPSTGVSSYTIQLKNTVGTPASEIITFNIYQQCRYETFRIHFMNNLGGFSAYNFTSRSKRSSSISRKQYTYDRPRVDGDGLVYTHADNGTVDYIVKHRGKVKLKSDWITDAQNEFLKELKTSPQVYLEFSPDGVHFDLMPVYVTNTNWTEDVESIDKLFQFECDIELSHLNIRQRR